MQITKTCIYSFLSLFIVSILMSCSTKPTWRDYAYKGLTAEAINEIYLTKDIKTVTIYGENSLLWASSIGDATLVSRLLAFGANVDINNEITGETPLIAASKKGNIDVINVLVKHGASKTKYDGTGNDAISAAIGAGKLEAIPVLIDAGFKLDSNKSNLLLLNAAIGGDIKTVEKLLEFGASVNYQNSNGESALMGAVKSGNAELVRTLISRGAKVELKDTAGRTALISASQAGCWECCEALIASGTDINTRDARGNTPIMWAIITGHKNIANQFIQRNVDITQKNRANKNALFLAAFDSEIARSILRINDEIPEVVVEADNYSDPAFSYEKLGNVLEDELVRGHGNSSTINNIKFVYKIATKHFDTTANQYVDLASSLRTKQVLNVAGSILLTAASIAVASASAQQQAHQMAEVSAVGGGSGRGVGYGMYAVVTPGQSNWESAKICDAKADELKKLAESCRKKAECYDKVKAGQEKLCLN